MVEVVGHRQDHFIAGIAQHLDHGVEGHVAAGGHEHRAGLQVEPVVLVQVLCDGGPQGRQPLHRAIAVDLGIALQGLPGG